MLVTKYASLTFAALLFSAAAFSQITNKGFEQSQEEGSILPWKVKTVAGYSYILDKTTKHSGKSALKLYSAKNEQGSYVPFSQQVPIKVDRLKRIAVTAYIKCDQVQTESTLWCQVWDENDKQIGFQNLGGQGVKVSGTSDWVKYTMPMTVNTNAKKLLLGGYLSGTGTAWFDDFEIEDISGNGQSAAAAVTGYLNEFVGIVKRNSLYTSVLDWPDIERDVVTLSAGMNKVEEARPVLDYIIGKLRAVGDNHSFIQNKVVAAQYTKVNSNPAKPESRLISGNIGYISVPGFSSTNSEVSVQFAADIQDMIRKLDTENQIAGWVVDLRGNTGGNMYPMIAGLGPLTGEGTLGYFSKVLDNKEIKTNWFYKKGSSGVGSGTSVTVPKPYQVKRKSAKVAVLIGPSTGSSGEMTAISFIGRKNTRLFGAASGGYTTANGSFYLSDGATLLLASSVTADRNFKKYIKNIIPDQIVLQNAGGSDEGIKAAGEWLLEK